MAKERAARRNAERFGRNRDAKTRAEEARSPSVGMVTVFDERTQRYASRPAEKRDGLEWLRAKRHISADEYGAGLWFAECFRWSQMDGDVPIPSLLSREEGGRGAWGDLPGANMAIAEWAAQARAEMARIRSEIGVDAPDYKRAQRGADTELALIYVCVHGVRLSVAKLPRDEGFLTIGELRSALGRLADLKEILRAPSEKQARPLRQAAAG